MSQPSAVRPDARRPGPAKLKNMNKRTTAKPVRHAKAKLLGTSPFRVIRVIRGHLLLDSLNPNLTKSD